MANGPPQLNVFLAYILPPGFPVANISRQPDSFLLYVCFHGNLSIAPYLLMKASVCVVGKIGVVLRSFFNSDCVLLLVNEECIVFVNLWCCPTLINTDLDVFFLFYLY